MKKIVFASLLLAMLCLFGCALAQGETTTLLVYMCGTDLQDAACEDLIEMAEVEAGDAINVVVLAGGAEEWDFEEFQPGGRTLAVIRDGYFEDLQDWRKASMGGAESLAEFLRCGFTEYPADRMIVVLWDHGAGSEGGICFDETADDDGLTIAEINEVLSSLERSVPGWHIDIFGCDACMMATYEMAAMLSNYDIDYFVASEELEPGTGWYYTEWLEMLAEDPGMSDADLCGAIVDSYMEEGLYNDEEDYLTLSAVDLSAMRDLKQSMEQFAKVISGQAEAGNLSALRRGRSRLYAFGSFDDASWDMVDLGALLDAYAQFDPQLAAQTKKALSKAVIFSAQTDNLDACCGLSILVPEDTAESFDEYREGFDISDIIPNWVYFVNAYVELLQGGHYQFTATDVAPITEDSDTSGTFTSFLSGFFTGGYAWDDEAEIYDESAWDTEEIEILDGAQGFTAMLPVSDLEYLDYVEGMLLMDLSEDGQEAYVDFGTMQNNLVDWSTGKVVSLYDGSWPVFGGQPVPLYDQTSNDHSRRSLIPVKLNGVYTYLVVVFPAGGTEGRVIGANAGYDDNGLPIRSVTRLTPGDEIVPIYTMYYEEDGEEELQEAEFEGDRIVWQEGMTVTYEDLSDEDDPFEMLFCFVFNDIFGEYTMSEFVAFEL